MRRLGEALEHSTLANPRRSAKNEGGWGDDPIRLQQSAVVGSQVGWARVAQATQNTPLHAQFTVHTAHGSGAVRLWFPWPLARSTTGPNCFHPPTDPRPGRWPSRAPRWVGGTTARCAHAAARAHTATRKRATYGFAAGNSAATGEHVRVDVPERRSSPESTKSIRLVIVFVGQRRAHARHRRERAAGSLCPGHAAFGRTRNAQRGVSCWLGPGRWCNGHVAPTRAFPPVEVAGPRRRCRACVCVPRYPIFLPPIGMISNVIRSPIAAFRTISCTSWPFFPFMLQATNGARDAGSKAV